MEREERQWLDQTKRLLDEGVDALEFRTHAALRRARQRAVFERVPPRRSHALWVGGAVAATVAVLVVFWLQVSHQTGTAGVGPEEMDALVTLEAEEIVDDLEFYEWLAKDERAS